MFIINALFFIINNFGLILLGIVLTITLYSWITMFKNRDYNFIIDYNRKYKNRELTVHDLDNIKHEIEHMEGREFEVFSEWLFKKIGKYKSVTLTPAENDEGRDLILIDENNNKIFVECKRYTDKATTTEEFMIGREIWQKLIGSMIADNIEKGIIVTTGNIHQNAWDYINKLEKNTGIKIDIIALDEIMRTIERINSSEVLDIVGLDY